VPKYQPISEAAKRLGIAEGYLRQLCIAGEVPGAMKFGKSWAIPAGFRRKRQRQKHT
jgi:excisionase family DNA binding protein